MNAVIVRSCTQPVKLLAASRQFPDIPQWPHSSWPSLPAPEAYGRSRSFAESRALASQHPASARSVPAGAGRASDIRDRAFLPSVSVAAGAKRSRVYPFAAQ